MKNQCSKCRQAIDSWDFYVESRSGKICSSCLVAQELPSQEYQALFKLSTSTVSMGELGQRELEAEPLMLARSSG